MLEARRLSKRYPDRQGRELVVLDQVSFAIPRAQFACLLGPSGCGKTTVLRIVAGLTSADDGEVLVDGDVIRGPGLDRSLVFQNYGLLPWRTVMGNVEFALEIQRVPKRERRRRAKEQIDRLNLTGFERHYPHEISGGMQQRVGLARAFTKNPKVLLMDEPFAAVDMQTRELLQEELLRIWETVKITVLFVTHSIEEAVYLADRVLVMSARPGRIKDDVTVDLGRPRAADVKASPEYRALAERLRNALTQSGKQIG